MVDEKRKSEDPGFVKKGEYLSLENINSPLIFLQDNLKNYKQFKRHKGKQQRLSAARVEAFLKKNEQIKSLSVDAVELGKLLEKSTPEEILKAHKEYSSYLSFIKGLHTCLALERQFLPKQGWLKNRRRSYLRALYEEACAQADKLVPFIEKCLEKTHSISSAFLSAYERALKDQAKSRIGLIRAKHEGEKRILENKLLELEKTIQAQQRELHRQDIGLRKLKAANRALREVNLGDHLAMTRLKAERDQLIRDIKTKEINDFNKKTQSLFFKPGGDKHPIQDNASCEEAAPEQRQTKNLLLQREEEKNRYLKDQNTSLWRAFCQLRDLFIELLEHRIMLRKMHLQTVAKNYSPNTPLPTPTLGSPTQQRGARKITFGEEGAKREINQASILQYVEKQTRDKHQETPSGVVNVLKELFHSVKDNSFFSKANQGGEFATDISFPFKEVQQAPRAPKKRPFARIVDITETVTLHSQLPMQEQRSKTAAP